MKNCSESTPDEATQEPPPSQWQEAVDAAIGVPHLDATRKYGIFNGGPVVNVEHCKH